MQDHSAYTLEGDAHMYILCTRKLSRLHVSVDRTLVQKSYAGARVCWKETEAYHGPVPN